jgi:sugar (pentulose or hexulose) kinase
MSKPKELIAVIDVGKTNVKLTCIDTVSGASVFSAQKNNSALTTPVGKQLDVAAIEAWLVETLSNFPLKKSISALFPVAHGAAAALIDAQGNVIAVPDYEDPIFDQSAPAYQNVRDPFEATFSPSLAAGLNLGAQWFFFEREHEDAWRRTAHLLLYPQYWAWRFCGVMASEVTSLGCHSDAWSPTQRQFSTCARTRKWDRLLPPIRYAGDVLGTVSASMAHASGLSPSCKVLCGMHDSSASFLGHRARRNADTPFSIISSGTWTVIMATHVDLHRLRCDHDMLANVDVFGSPVATARFMGGREFATIAGTTNASIACGPADIERVIDAGSMALPSFVQTGGPFPNQPGRCVNAQNLDAAAFAALATLYVALVTDWLLDELQTHGDLLIDGPLARNPKFAAVMQALRPRTPVYLAHDQSGAEAAAWYLYAGKSSAGESSVPAQLDPARIALYRTQWRKLAIPDL